MLYLYIEGKILYKVLGVDFSLNGTGLAVYNENVGIDSASVFSLKESEFSEIITIPKFSEQPDKLDWVCNSILEHTQGIDFICMEEHIGSYYSWMDGYAILKYFFRKQSIPYITISPTSLKKFVISGKADKNQMSYALRTEFSKDFDYLGECADNIVDASWLAIIGMFYYRRYFLQHRFNLSKEKSEVLEKILKGKNNKWQRQFK